MLVNVEFTSLVELDLDRVSEGSLDWIEVVKKVYNSFYKDVEIQMKNKSIVKSNKNYEQINLGKYKKKDIIIKTGKYGPYISYNNKNYNLKYILEKKELKSLKIEDIKDLIDYPMNIGKHDKKMITIHIGPYGKYMKYNNKNYRIPQKDKYELRELINLL